MIYGRWRDIVSTAEFDAERLLSGNAGERREVLNRLSAGHSEYAWVGFADKAGIVQAASGDLLVGTSVNSRPWFSAGLRGVHAGDVHTATLLSQHLASERSEPLRFIDISAPVRDAGGQVAGILAVHLYWDWATETERLLNRALRAVSPNAEVLIAAKDGTVLLGPAALQGQKLDNWASVIPEVVADRTVQARKDLGWDCRRQRLSRISRSGLDCVGAPQRRGRPGPGSRLAAKHVVVGAHRFLRSRNPAFLASMIVTRPVRALERTATDLNSENTALATQLLKIAEVAPGVICSFKLSPNGKTSFSYAAANMKEIYGIDPAAVREDAAPILKLVHPGDWIASTT